MILSALLFNVLLTTQYNRIKIKKKHSIQIQAYTVVKVALSIKSLKTNLFSFFSLAVCSESKQNAKEHASLNTKVQRYILQF